MSRRALLATVFVALAMWLWAASPALAGGNDVAHNLGSEIRHWAASLYGGVVALFGLGFLINRKFTDLAVFLVAAILVGWLVFSPDQVADAARAIGNRILP